MMVICDASHPGDSFDDSGKPRTEKGCSAGGQQLVHFSQAHPESVLGMWKMGGLIGIGPWVRPTWGREMDDNRHRQPIVIGDGSTGDVGDGNLDCHYSYPGWLEGDREANLRAQSSSGMEEAWRGWAWTVRVTDVLLVTCSCQQ